MRQVVLYTAFGTTRYNFMKAVETLQSQGDLQEVPGNFYDSTVVLDPLDSLSVNVLNGDLSDRNRICVVDGIAFCSFLSNLRDAPNLYIVVSYPNNGKPFIASSIKEAQMKLAPLM